MICREFNVNEEWLRTGDGDMFLSGPRDELDEMVTRYGLPKEFRALAEKFLSLKPDARQVVLDYMQDVAAALTAESAADRSAEDQRAIWEAEARAEVDREVERYRQQLLSEKLRESQALSAKESDVG